MEADVTFTKDEKVIITLKSVYDRDWILIERIKERKNLSQDNFKVMVIEAKAIPHQKQEDGWLVPAKLEILI
jgi:hypothetical protein